MTPRPFSSLGPALRLLGLTLLVAALQSSRGAWSSLSALVQGGTANLLPGGWDIFAGLIALAAGAFYLRQADENTQALAGALQAPVR